jgi:hypothetical protein
MLGDLEAADEIVHLTDDLLRRAEAYGRFPTPVDDILAAANLKEAPEGFLTWRAIAEAPAHLRAALRSLRGKAHAVLDRREHEVHINPETDRRGQGAFKRLHETAHDLFYWQHVAPEGEIQGFADDDLTLSPRTNILFEQEANQGAAELLFQRDQFAKAAADYRISFGAVVELHEHFGSSIHAAFRRFVETHERPVAGVVLGAKPSARDPLAYTRREAMCSSSWRERFEDPVCWPRHLEEPCFSFVEQARACAGFGDPAGTWRHIDRANDTVPLNVEAFHNTYSTFVLIWLPAKQRFKRKVIVAKAA